MDKAFTLAESQDERPGAAHRAPRDPGRRKAGGVVWFDFKTLCGGPRSQNDYLESPPSSTRCC
jgi:cell division protein ZapE